MIYFRQRLPVERYIDARNGVKDRLVLVMFGYGLGWLALYVFGAMQGR